MHRDILENLGSSPFAKKHVRIVLATEAREGLTLKTKPSVLRGAAHCIVRWQEESLENLSRSRCAEKYVHKDVFGMNE